MTESLRIFLASSISSGHRTEDDLGQTLAVADIDKDQVRMSGFSEPAAEDDFPAFVGRRRTPA
jgi:hypothetical protein